MLLRLVLPCDPMGHAILGDLHEEFQQDIVQRGPSEARARYARLALGIVAYAVRDSLRWRSWVSSPPESDAEHSYEVAHAASRRREQIAGSERVLRFWSVGGRLAFAVLAFGVLGFMVVMNSTVFAAVQGSPQVATASPQTAGAPALLIVLGIVSLVALIGCAALAMILMCIGPRWRRARTSLRQSS